MIKFIQKIFDMDYKDIESQKGGAVLRAFDENGDPLNIYSDEELCVLHPNPIKADYMGIFPRLYLNPDDKKAAVIELEDRSGHKMTIS